MTSALGAQTVNFVKVTEGVKDRFGHPAPVRDSTPQPGCLMQPFAARERSGVRENEEELTTVALEQWRCTAPATAVSMSMTANDELEYEGVTYKVVTGSAVYRDLDGNVSHVTVVCEREVG